MVIDGAKGIEAQTKKLFKVCAMRGIPIFTFINKLDRETKDAFDLVQELEDVLGIASVPITWPIGSGINFEGIYDIQKNEVVLYKAQKTLKLGEDGVFGPELEGMIAGYNLSTLRDEIELITGAGNEFDMDAIEKGKLSPVFFGSALADFGTTQFLEHFLDMSPAPGVRKAKLNGEDIEIRPEDEDFSGFIFKIQANMNPAHRDRLAFFRICSGTFERGMEVKLSRTGKNMKLAQSTMLMANERENVETAIAGDVIGIYDTGNYQIGDTLSTVRGELFFEPLPTFPAEMFALVSPKDTMKAKQFQKGVDQLAQEGAIQVYRNQYNEVVVGAVGQLQFEVFEYRLKNEYNAAIRMDRLDMSVVRWLGEGMDLEHVKDVIDSRQMLVFDHFQRPLLLFANQFTLNYFQEKHEDIKLVEALDVVNKY
jgi:peptide chain release factor 3